MNAVARCRRNTVVRMWKDLLHAIVIVRGGAAYQEAGRAR